MKLYTAFTCVALVLAVANNVEAQLPDFTYSLTQEPVGDRQNLCAQNMGYCVTNCGGTDKAPKNFCNVTTMGWGCGCVDKVPDYESYQWPINYQDCVHRGTACKQVCSKLSGAQIQSCNTACINKYDSTCGTPQEPPAYYKVDSVDQTPTYGPPNNSSSSSNGTSSNNGGSNGGSNSNSTKGSGSSNGGNLGVAYHIGSAITGLFLTAIGMMML